MRQMVIDDERNWWRRFLCGYLSILGRPAITYQEAEAQYWADWKDSMRGGDVFNWHEEDFIRNYAWKSKQIAERLLTLATWASEGGLMMVTAEDLEYIK